MSLPASQLLDKFGAGSHKPGSGSAAALMGILAGKLIITVGHLTLAKPRYKNDHSKISFIMERIDSDIEPKLRILFEEDARIFDEVIQHRLARDAAKGEKEKRRHRDAERDAMQIATDIPIEICELCLGLVDHGVAMFDIGFASARGDSGAAVSAALAGAMSAIFVVNLNLRKFREGKWSASRRGKARQLHDLLEAKQLIAFGRVSVLEKKDLDDLAPSLFDVQ